MRLVSYTRTTSCFPEAEVRTKPITEQNERIKKYADAHGWKISDKYSDRKKDYGENGAFDELLTHGMKRAFDAVIVDSIYYAGKDLWTAKEVLLQTFQYAGIGFIVVEDDFVSMEKTNEEAEAYFAEKYKRYRRQSIQFQNKKRMRNGLLSRSDQVYGYELSEDRCGLLINDEQAEVVREVFSWYANGMSCADIASELEKREVLKPSAVSVDSSEAKGPFKWSQLTITRMLSRPIYRGSWTKKQSGEEIEFTCEPIISDQLFSEVQRIMKDNASDKRPQSYKQTNRYAGLVCDSNGVCSFTLAKLKSGEQYYYKKIRESRSKDKERAFVADLDKEVRSTLDAAKQQALKICIISDEEMIARQEEFIIPIRLRFQNCALLVAAAEKKRVATTSVVEQRSEWETDENRDLVGTMEQVFAEYPAKVKHIEKLFSINNPWVELVQTWKSSMPLEKKVLRKYVERVVINDDWTISVILKEKQWYLELPEDWRKE